MKTTIGFDRPIQLDWLDLIASRFASTGDSTVALADTRTVVEDAVGGGESPHRATGKRMTILARIWLKVPEHAVGVRDAAAESLARLGPTDRLAIHWAMCELAYPFYLDAASIVGRTFALTDDVTLSAVRARLSERWGALGSMPAASQRLLKMWDSWGVLQAIDARGTYGVVPARSVETLATRLVAEIRVLAEDTRALDLNDLQRASDLFPFVLAELMPALASSKAIQVNREGGRRLVVRSV